MKGSEPKPATSETRGALVLFVLLWTGGVAFFSSHVLPAVWRQHQTSTWPSTEGRILSSRVTTKDNGEGGAVYGVGVQYEYTVHGVRHESTRYRRSQWNTSAFWHADRVVASLPAGKPVVVYYDPSKPSRAVLDRGLGGGDFFMLLFLTPFIGAALLGWAVVVISFFAPNETRVATLREGRRLYVCPSHVPTWALVAGVVIVTSLACVMVGMFFFWGHLPPTAAAAMGCLVIGAPLAVVWQRRRSKIEERAIMIDYQEGTMSLPSTLGRVGTVQFPLDRILGFEVDHDVVHPGSEHEVHLYTLEVVFLDANGIKCRESLAQAAGEEEATALVSYLERARIADPGEDGRLVLVETAV